MKLREHNKNYQFQGLLIRVCYKELIGLRHKDSLVPDYTFYSYDSKRQYVQ